MLHWIIYAPSDLNCAGSRESISVAHATVSVGTSSAEAKRGSACETTAPLATMAVSLPKSRLDKSLTIAFHLPLQLFFLSASQAWTIATSLPPRQDNRQRHRSDSLVRELSR